MEGSSVNDEFETELLQVKEDLMVYRELMIKFNNVLEWEQGVYPVILTLAVSAIYFLAWLLSPSFLTIFCLGGILYFSLDFLGPKFLPVLYRYSEWDSMKESRFNSICTRLLHGKKHFLMARSGLLQLEKKNPKFYYPMMIAIFSFIMWLGLNINSFLISYFLSLTILLLPGFRKYVVDQEISKDDTSRPKED